MSGVIDEKGRQWEHCCACSKFVLLKNLGYQRPGAGFPHGRDLCVGCVDNLIRAGEVDFKDIVPAKSWQVVEV